VITVVLQIVRALFAQNTLLRARIAGRSVRPPNERLARLERQLAFSFATPTNDLTPGAQAKSGDGGAAKDKSAKDKPAKDKPQPRKKLPDGLPEIVIPNNVPEARRVCGTCMPARLA
jgi:hypothetical protein